ncbi:UNVERIFIED_CONTAM: hypothetical protein Slati_1741100 [Sesamum latifolium]|uniref:Reverse transcriptase domain-containing protein n=1 Tax=Sesamum latifolium TaxID=2727402 RepID=A0AAW2X0D5_9LAMI
MDEVLGCLESRVTTAMNDELTKPFTSEEITRALKQIHPLKSLGLDVSISQSAFVPGRLIMDNVLLAYELNHFLKLKTWGKKGHVSLKLDVSKAYDRVEWCFLESVLEAFSSLIRKAEREGAIQGAAVSHSAPLVSHLFADDTLIFCQATMKTLARLQLILTSFEAASGLKINKHKSAMVFSRNVEEGVRSELA